MRVGDIELAEDCILDSESTDLGLSSHISSLPESPQNPKRVNDRSNDVFKPKKPADRFIPLRTPLEDFSGRNFLQEKENLEQNLAEKTQALPEGTKMIKPKKRLLKFNTEKTIETKEEEVLVQDMASRGLLKVNKAERKGKLLGKAEKVLDAPGLLNDYYLNLIDWGQKNLLAVCLGEGAFVWNASTQEGHQFFCSDNSLMLPTSVAWAPLNPHIMALGFSNSQVHLRDYEKGGLLRDFDDHWARVSAISWNPTLANVFSTSSKDCEIINYDMRMNRSLNLFRGHTQEVCGLKWSPDGQFLASGGNDNCLMIWDPRKPEYPLHQFKEHKAAVKALAWCPWQKGLIVSGGGSEDKTVKSWRVDEGKQVGSFRVSSQVCSLLWHPTERELLAAHGYSQFQLTLWRYPSMEVAAEFFGHRDRVLHLALSPDQRTVVSAGADEALRFWNVFDSSRDPLSLTAPKSSLAPLSIR